MTGAIILREIYAPICHDNGTVTYWCPRRQEWVRGTNEVPDDALDILPDELAARVRRHLFHHLATCA